jgi:cobalt/nickel transport system permease protein
MHRRDARAKILVLVVFLIVLATTRRELPLLAIELLAFLVAALAWARVPVTGVLVRAAVILPFAALFGGITWLGGDAARAGALVIKSYLSTLAVLVVVSTTPLPVVLKGLETMGAPCFVLEVSQFLYRYLFVISEEAHNMRRAAAARTDPVRGWLVRREGFKASAGALGALFARSYARAEAIHRSMLARGFDGRLPVMSHGSFLIADALFTIIGGSIPWLLRQLAERTVS